MLNDPLSSSAIRRMLLVAVYFLAAAASFSGYFSKWHFRDDMPAASLPKMLDGTADRPYVYRQLLPAIANGIERALPVQLKQRADALLLDDNPSHHPISRMYSNTPDSRDPRYALRYYLIYAMSFASLLLALFALRTVCLDLQSDGVGATLAPLAFAAGLPLLLTEGGYFYDMPELLFMALAVHFALKGRVLPLIVLTALATWNKESFLFFTLTLYPFLRGTLSIKSTLRIQMVLLAVAAGVNVLIKLKYAQNAGGFVYIHLMDNLRFLANPLSYLHFEYNYGVPTPKGFNVINLVLIAVLVKTAWSRLAPSVRQSLTIGVVVNVPLFLAFCYRDELRNFSLLFVGFVVILCANIDAYVESRYRVGRVAVQIPDAGLHGAQAVPDSAPLTDLPKDSFAAYANERANDHAKAALTPRADARNTAAADRLE